MENVAMLAIENCLIQPLVDIFTGQSVNEMHADLVEYLGQETLSSTRQRNSLREDLEKYKSASKAVHRLTRPSLNSHFFVAEPNMLHSLRPPELQDIISLPNPIASSASGTLEKRETEPDSHSQSSNKRVRTEGSLIPCTIGLDWYVPGESSMMIHGPSGESFQGNMLKHI